MPFTRRGRIRQALAQPFPQQWRDFLSRRMAVWSSLTDGEREHLEELIRIILVEKLWEASKGFDLTEEVRVLVGALACVPILGLDYDYYHRVTAIIVSSGTVVIEGDRHIGGGIHTDAPEEIIGQASYEGPVLVAWNAARHQARHPDQGHNVVYHEFAHKLDMLDGSVDGMPPIEASDQRRRWVDVCTYEYRLLCAGASGDLLDPYGAENPGEFFAVATEAFFCLPKQMASDKPALYEVLRDFYRQDPAVRLRS